MENPCDKCLLSVVCHDSCKELKTYILSFLKDIPFVEETKSKLCNTYRRAYTGYYISPIRFFYRYDKREKVYLQSFPVYFAHRTEGIMITFNKKEIEVDNRDVPLHKMYC